MAGEDYPPDLLYHPEHDWARVKDGEATFGITWFAQDQLGEVVFFDPPEAGASTAANEALSDTPEKVNDDPYGDGWLVRVRLSDPSEADALLDVEAYRERLASESSE